MPENILTSSDVTFDQYLKYTHALPTYILDRYHLLSAVDLKTRCPLDQSRNQQHPTHDLSVFDRLPLELQQSVLRQVDLETLIGFRTVNRLALQVVDSMPEYRNIITHRPDALRAVLSIGTSSHTTLTALWKALTSSKCVARSPRSDGVECGDFSSYINLLLCQRVCRSCNEDRLNFLPLTISEAICRYDIRPKTAAKLPHMRSVPGIYSPMRRECRERITLVDREAAHLAGERRHGSERALQRYMRKERVQVRPQYQDAQIQGTEGRPRLPNYYWPLDACDGYERRFMAVIHAPPLDKMTMVTQESRQCVGCLGTEHCRREFTRETFIEHLAKRGPIRELGKGVWTLWKHVDQ